MSPIHPTGFGYLIPRPKNGYETREGIDGVLGCVFDSCAVQGQDEGEGAENLTKMTVMMRPSGDTMGVMKHLQRVLRPGHENKDRLPDPVWMRVTDQKNCIPTYLPGHLDRMEELKDSVSRVWEGRGVVVGAGVDGVSIGDCVEYGRRAGREWS
jgi:oxygen-dependent protoporphyrinogen oxidase